MRISAYQKLEMLKNPIVHTQKITQPLVCSFSKKTFNQKNIMLSFIKKKEVL